MATPTASLAASLVIQPNQPKAISPDLWGLFFEDLNYAADGGLYAELIQNRSFEYHATEQPTWNSLSFWEFTARGAGQGSWAVDDSLPIHANNPHCVVLHVATVGEGVGLVNLGFDGIAVQEGHNYELALFGRQLYMDDRWGPGSVRDGRAMPLLARLETQDGEVLAEASLEVAGIEWHQATASLTANKTEAQARFVLLGMARGGVALDEISLLPRNTFRNRPNGLRADLAQVLAEIKPKFVRFPGGCLAHGHSLSNMYRWKETLGPIEQRRGQANLWGYHQSVGLGYFEYFQFCEDIGAKPVPVVPAGVSCQNSGHCSGVGQQAIPLEAMPAYIQDVLDLIEWANGPADSVWGAKRAEAGHPAPFGLEYLGVGNEDHISPAFKERFQMIYDAVQQKHPEITVIGTTGPFHSGEDYDEGWKIANEMNLEMVDEHYYVEPQWCWENLHRYDAYDRNGATVYLGEYAAHEKDRKNTLRSALAEAAFMTHLERNGDVVRLASYAPLLAKRGRTQWLPDLIYFDNTSVTLTANYFVQQLFSQHAGDASLPVQVEFPSDSPVGESPIIAASCVQDSLSGDVILKIVSRADASIAIEISGLSASERQASCTVLTGDPLAENAFGAAPHILPQTSMLMVASRFTYHVPPQSLSIIRLPNSLARA